MSHLPSCKISLSPNFMQFITTGLKETKPRGSIKHLTPYSGSKTVIKTHYTIIFDRICNWKMFSLHARKIHSDWRLQRGIFHDARETDYHYRWELNSWFADCSDIWSKIGTFHDAPAIVLKGWTIAQPIIPPSPLVAKMIGLGSGAGAAFAAGVGDEIAEVVLAMFVCVFAAQ